MVGDRGENSSVSHEINGSRHLSPSRRTEQTASIRFDFSYAPHIGNDGRSVPDCLDMYWGGLVIRFFRTQKLVSLSRTEAEFIHWQILLRMYYLGAKC